MPVIVRYFEDVDGHLAGEMFQVPSEELAAQYHPNATVIAATQDVWIPQVIEALTGSQLGQVQALINATIEPVAINFVIDGGGNPIAAGLKGDFFVPFNGLIRAVTIGADVSGSITLEIRQGASFPPTLVTLQPSLVASAFTRISGLSLPVAANDAFRVNVLNATSVTRVTLGIEIDRS